jgi:hypothetical protein
LFGKPLPGKVDSIVFDVLPVCSPHRLADDDFDVELRELSITVFIIAKWENDDFFRGIKIDQTAFFGQLAGSKVEERLKICFFENFDFWKIIEVLFKFRRPVNGKKESINPTIL